MLPFRPTPGRAGTDARAASLRVGATTSHRQGAPPHPPEAARRPHGEPDSAGEGEREVAAASGPDLPSPDTQSDRTPRPRS